MREIVQVGITVSAPPIPPHDPNQPAKLLGDILTGRVVDAVDDGKNPVAAELGHNVVAARAS